jgi:hypothetical protein
MRTACLLFSFVKYIEMLRLRNFYVFSTRTLFSLVIGPAMLPYFSLIKHEQFKACIAGSYAGSCRG